MKRRQVLCLWNGKSGAPYTRFGTALLEVWTLAFGINAPGDVEVSAQIVAATFDANSGTWRRMWPSGMAAGDPIPCKPNERIRRHAMLRETSTTVGLTVGDWNV